VGIVYCIDKEKNITYELWKGTVDASDFILHAEQLVADTDWREHRAFHIVDLRDATLDGSIDHDTIEDAADYFGILLYKLPPAKVALVTTAETERAGFFGKYLAHFGYTVNVVKDINEAVQCLGVDAGGARSAFDQLHAFKKKEGRFILPALKTVS
jgi:hypothetical protein